MLVTNVRILSRTYVSLIQWSLHESWKYWPVIFHRWQSIEWKCEKNVEIEGNGRQEANRWKWAKDRGFKATVYHLYASYEKIVLSSCSHRAEVIGKPQCLHSRRSYQSSCIHCVENGCKCRMQIDRTFDPLCSIFQQPFIKYCFS